MAMSFQVHARSISLPSRLHPGSLLVEDRLNKLKTELESSLSSLSSIRASLVGLADVILSLNDLIQSPSTQQSLSRYDRGRAVDEALESSVSLIGACSACRDMASSLKDHARGLQSALRRRKSGVDDVAAHVAAYVAFRKSSKKDISRCIRELKKQAESTTFGPVLDADLHLGVVVRVIGEVVSAAVSVFQSLLVFLSVPPLIKSSKWSLVSRLVTAVGSSSSINGDLLNEIGAVDVAVLSRNGDLEGVQGRLRAVDSGSQELETALHDLFRCFLQNRVTLLNIITATTR